jgi:hypothetical protein
VINFYIYKSEYRKKIKVKMKNERQLYRMRLCNLALTNQHTTVENLGKSVKGNIRKDKKPKKKGKKNKEKRTKVKQNKQTKEKENKKEHKQKSENK